jgi:hypothetical protein
MPLVVPLVPPTVPAFARLNAIPVPAWMPSLEPVIVAPALLVMVFAVPPCRLIPLRAVPLTRPSLVIVALVPLLTMPVAARICPVELLVT